MYRRTHRSWREPKTPFRSVGEIYLDSDMFSSDDEGAKTIGKPIIGPDALEILENRRKIKGRLNDYGAQRLHEVVSMVKEVFPDEEVKVTWDRYCGCSMCPCSPGYRIKVRFTKGGFSSNEKNRFSLHLTTNKNNVEYSFFKPKDGFWIGYDKVRRLQEIFSNGKPEPEKS